MTQHCIWWWGFSSGALGIVDYPFIVICVKSTLTWSGSTCYGPIYKSNRSVWKLVYNRVEWGSADFRRIKSETWAREVNSGD